MRIIAIVAVTLLVTASLGCKKDHEEAETCTSASTSYQVIEVKNGATITGTVKLGSTQNSATIMIQKDQDACGNSHVNPSAPGTSGGVQGAIVYLEEIHAGKAFDAMPAKLDQKGCEFVPHVQILKQGSEILVANLDKALHNANFKLAGTSVTNFAQPEGTPPRPVTLERSGLYTINCDVHSWMRAFAMVVAHPYYTLTDASGHYSLANIPPGSYTLKLWRDNWQLDQSKDNEGRIMGYKWGPDLEKEQKVTVRAGENQSVDFALP